MKPAKQTKPKRPILRTSTPVETKIVVTLTDEAPVRISPVEWGTVANAVWVNGEKETAYIRVREKRADDSQCLVYGERKAGPLAPKGYQPIQVGFRLESPSDSEIITAIARVGAMLGVESLASRCIADLPPEDL